MASQLVGRERELAALDAALGSGTASLIAVVGEPGIGKSRLLAEVAARGEAGGALVLLGRAAEFERDLPFAAWVDALDDHLHSREHEPVGEFGGQEAVDELGSVLPALGTRASARAGAPLLDERHRLHAAVRSLLTALAARDPLVLLLDDLHWADPGSIDLLASLLRRPPQASVTVVAALRPHPSPPRLAAALDRAERDGRLTRLTLEPLTAAECDVLLGDAALIGSAVPPGQRAQLRRDSGGNPFYLQALARSAGRGGAVPRSVRDAIAEELRVLPAGVRQVLEAAAVAGDPFDPELVASAAGRAEDEVVEALDALIGSDLVRPTPVPRRFVLRHPLVRRAVYESAGAGWRLGAHGRAAATLRERDAPRAIQAHHVALSARAGDEQAIELLTAAARESLARAPATAARWLQVTLDLLGPDTAPARRVRLLERLGEALAATGQLAEGRAALLAALALVADDAVAERGRLTAVCARVEHRLGLLDDAHTRLRAALDALPEGPGPERMSLLVELAADGFHRGKPDEMAAWAARGLAAAQDLADRPHAAAAQAVLALADVLVGNTESATALATAAGAAVDALSDDELAVRLDGVHYLNMAEMYTERFEPMIAHAVRAADVARTSRQGELLGVLTQSHGFGAGILGRLTEAVAVLDAAVEAERLSGTPYSLAWVLMNASIAATWSGDVATGIRLAEESCVLIREVGSTVIAAYPTAALAAARLEAGNPAQAAELLVEGCGGPELSLMVGFWRANCLEDLVRAELGRGRPDAAARAADLALDWGTELGLDLAVGWGRRGVAAVRLDAGDAAAAAELALASAADFAVGVAPVEEGRSRLLAGRALAGGHREEAVAQLRAAAALFERCGATGRSGEVARELRRLGHRPRRAPEPASGLAALSTREREVAELVAAGRTNGEIARELYLSTKTVESHLRHLFAKLGASSRVEVALAVRGAGAAATGRRAPG